MKGFFFVKFFSSSFFFNQGFFFFHQVLCAFFFHQVLCFFFLFIKCCVCFFLQSVLYFFVLIKCCCLFLTIHIATALHLFSACTLDVTSTVMTRMHVRSSMCAHSPLSGSSMNESCAQDTEQKHGKHGSGAPLSSFPLLLVVVLAKHGGCLSSDDRDRELRIWNEREAETRWTAYLERARSSIERV